MLYCAMKVERLTLSEAFRVVRGNRRSQAAELFVIEGSGTAPVKKKSYNLAMNEKGCDRS